MKKREPETFFNVILNSIADGVFTTDNEGKITFINKAAEEITGFSSKEAIGHFCFDIFRADICQTRCALKETLKTKREITNLPVTILNPNIAESDSTVLIQGASGTGKELFTKAIHHLSRREERPFIKVNCGALPDTLLESELFGYVKGAFTDAKKDKPGRFALANGGTIFLDEVGDMSPSLQVKLLRVLQEKEFEPLGSTSPRKTDVRIIAATNRDLSRDLSMKENSETTSFIGLMW